MYKLYKIYHIEIWQQSRRKGEHRKDNSKKCFKGNRVSEYSSKKHHSLFDWRKIRRMLTSRSTIHSVKPGFLCHSWQSSCLSASRVPRFRNNRFGADFRWNFLAVSGDVSRGGVYWTKACDLIPDSFDFGEIMLVFVSADGREIWLRGVCEQSFIHY